MMWKLCQFDSESRIKEISLKYRIFIVKKKFSVKKDRIFEETGVFRHSHARSKDVADQSAHKKSTTKQ
jgi:hypothetical protein